MTVAHPLIGAAMVEALPPGQRHALYRRLAALMDNPERSAHFLALAAGSGADSEVAAALDAASSTAHARAATPAAAQFAEQAVLFTPPHDATDLLRRRIRAGRAAVLGRRGGAVVAAARCHRRRQLGERRLRARAVVACGRDLFGARPAVGSGDGCARGTDRRAGPAPPRGGVRPGLRPRVRPARGSSGGGGRGDSLGGGRGPGTAGLALHRALVNLAAVKVAAAEGLDGGLLDRAAALEDDLTIDRLHDRADLSVVCGPLASRSWIRRGPLCSVVSGWPGNGVT